MIILSQKFQHEDQDFEIFVKYDEESKRPIEVKHINLHTHGNWYPIGTIMTKFFKEAVWKLILETDWEKVREEQDRKRQSLSNLLHPVMAMALNPFIVTGREVKETYN